MYLDSPPDGCLGKPAQPSQTPEVNTFKHRSIVAVLMVAVALAGCVSRQPMPVRTLSESARAELGRIAIRIEISRQVFLAGAVRGKGSGAASGAGRAVGDLIEGIGSSNELGVVLGLLFLPFVAAGGAVYGAAVASTAEEMQEDLATLEINTRPMGA